ncbi:MAG: phosphate ABC transporter permease PstA [Cyanobacteria bacterium J06638_28]
MTTEHFTNELPAAPTLEPRQRFKLDLSGRYRLDRFFKAATWTATMIALAVLVWLFCDILINGIPTLSWRLIASLPASDADRTGLLAALVGTAWIMVLVTLFSFPIGVGSGIFLEEFAEDNWFTGFIEINIGNLAGVPSIIYGMLGLGAFVQLFSFVTGGRSVLSGAMTLALLVLPIIIVATREALRSVPDSIRSAGYALGANRWQVIWSHTLPTAFPGILTGVILALSRAIGETAPLIVVGAVTYVSFLPLNPRDAFTVLPIQIYNWVSLPQKEFHSLAASGIIVLLASLLTMNSIAIFLRNRFQKAR